MEPLETTSSFCAWGVIAFKFNRLGFKETCKISGASEVPLVFKKQGWKYLKKY